MKLIFQVDNKLDMFIGLRQVTQPHHLWQTNTNTYPRMNASGYVNVRH